MHAGNNVVSYCKERGSSKTEGGCLQMLCGATNSMLESSVLPVEKCDENKRAMHAGNNVVSYCIERGSSKTEGGCLQMLCGATNSMWESSVLPVEKCDDNFENKRAMHAVNNVVSYCIERGSSKTEGDCLQMLCGATNSMWESSVLTVEKCDKSFENKRAMHAWNNVVSYCIERGSSKTEGGCLQMLCGATNSMWELSVLPVEKCDESFESKRAMHAGNNVVSYCIERGSSKTEGDCLQMLCGATNSMWESSVLPVEKCDESFENKHAMHAGNNVVMWS